jgi:hypothetical protein
MSSYSGFGCRQPLAPPLLDLLTTHRHAVDVPKDFTQRRRERRSTLRPTIQPDQDRFAAVR